MYYGKTRLDKIEGKEFACFTGGSRELQRGHAAGHVKKPAKINNTFIFGGRGGLQLAKIKGWLPISLRDWSPRVGNPRSATAKYFYVINVKCLLACLVTVCRLASVRMVMSRSGSGVQTGTSRSTRTSALSPYTCCPRSYVWGLARTHRSSRGFPVQNISINCI